jgi:multidrug resistance protein MdtO
LRFYDRRLGRDGKRTDQLCWAAIAFAFFYSVFQGYAPDTDLDNVRDRVVGILFGLIVTGLVFQYIWPERKAERIELPSST